MLQGTKSNGLYTNVLAFTATNKFADDSSQRTESDFKLTRWHQRLGDPSFDFLVHALKSCNISVPRNKPSSLYIACKLGKCHKLPLKPTK